MTTAASLDITARLYPSRPSHAWIRAFLLEACARAAEGPLPRPVVDLGCGDGRFARALAERGVAEVDVGIDFAAEPVAAAGRRPSLGGVRGDITALPFAEAAFATALCTTVLTSLVPRDPVVVDRVLAEAHRVLRPGGTLLASAATPAFRRNLMLRRWAARLSDDLADRYGVWVDRRHDHSFLLEPADLERRLAAAGFTIERRAWFDRPAHADGYARLRLFDGIGLARHLGSAALTVVGRGIAAGLAAPFRRGLARDPIDDPRGADDAGFVVLLARRPLSR